MQNPTTTANSPQITAPINGITFSGTVVVLGSSVDNYASPASWTGNYMSILAGQSETLRFSTKMDIFGLYWGSIDTYNSIEFLLNGVEVNLIPSSLTHKMISVILTKVLDINQSLGW